MNANGQLDILVLISILLSTNFMQIVKPMWEDEMNTTRCIFICCVICFVLQKSKYAQSENSNL